MKYSPEKKKKIRKDQWNEELFFEKIYKIDSFARLIKKKRENTNKQIKNERGDITTDTTEIQKKRKRLLAATRN